MRRMLVLIGIVGIVAGVVTAEAQTELFTGPPLAVAWLCDMGCLAGGHTHWDYADGTLVDLTGRTVLEAAARGLGFARAGAYGHGSYAWAISYPDSGAIAETASLVTVRRRRPSTSPLEVLILFAGIVEMPGCCVSGSQPSEAKWSVEFNGFGGFTPTVGRLLFEDHGVGPVLVGFDVPGPLSALEYGEFTEYDPASLRINHWIIDECCPTLNTHDPSPARRFRAIAKRILVSGDNVGHVFVRLSATASGNGTAYVHPEFRVPEDRDDLEIVLDNANPHPPGPAVTQQDLDILAAVRGRRAATAAPPTT